MTHFSIGLRNRIAMPSRHVLIVEDDHFHAYQWLEIFSRRYKREGDTVISVAASALAALEIPKHHPVTFAIVDHDLQFGNGRELIKYWRDVGCTFPIAAASGIPQNNAIMLDAGALIAFISKHSGNDVDEVLKILESGK